MTKFSFNRHGTALIELSVAILVLLMLIFGIIEFGRLMYAKNILCQAAREGARKAVVTEPGVFAHMSAASVVSRIDSQIRVHDMNPSTPISGNPVTVTVSKQFRTIVPDLIPVLSGITSLRGSATMRYER